MYHIVFPQFDCTNEEYRLLYDHIQALDGQYYGIYDRPSTWRIRQIPGIEEDETVTVALFDIPDEQFDTLMERLEEVFFDAHPPYIVADLSRYDPTKEYGLEEEDIGSVFQKEAVTGEMTTIRLGSEYLSSRMDLKYLHVPEHPYLSELYPDSEDRPYDVFISCKEFDERGEETPDSVYAGETAYALRMMGYKVFHPRTDLEKTTEYFETYLDAMNRSRIILVIASDPAFYAEGLIAGDRYRAQDLFDEDRGTRIIYAGVDINREDLPEELEGAKIYDCCAPDYLYEISSSIRATQVLYPYTASELSDMVMTIGLGDDHWYVRKLKHAQLSGSDFGGNLVEMMQENEADTDKMLWQLKHKDDLILYEATVNTMDELMKGLVFPGVEKEKILQSANQFLAEKLHLQADARMLHRVDCLKELMEYYKNYLFLTARREELQVKIKSAKKGVESSSFLERRRYQKELEGYMAEAEEVRQRIDRVKEDCPGHDFDAMCMKIQFLSVDIAEYYYSKGDYRTAELNYVKSSVTGYENRALYMETLYALVKDPVLWKIVEAEEDKLVIFRWKENLREAIKEKSLYVNG